MCAPGRGDVWAPAMTRQIFSRDGGTRHQGLRPMTDILTRLHRLAIECDVRASQLDKKKTAAIAHDAIAEISRLTRLVTLGASAS